MFTFLVISYFSQDQKARMMCIFDLVKAFVYIYILGEIETTQVNVKEYFWTNQNVYLYFLWITRQKSNLDKLTPPLTKGPHSVKKYVCGCKSKYASRKTFFAEKSPNCIMNG